MNGIFDRIFRHNPFTKKKSLLLIKVDSIGDYIIFRNFIEVLKRDETYKDHEITLLGNIWWKDISEKLDHAFIKTFIWVDYSKLDNLWYMFNVNRKLYARGFETALDPTFSRTSKSDKLLLRSGARYKIAQAGDTVNMDEDVLRKHNSRLTTVIDLERGIIHEFERTRLFFESLLKKKVEISRPEIKNESGEEYNTIIIGPGAKSPARQWSPENFYKLCEAIQSGSSVSYEFVIIGSEKETSIAEKIINAGSAIKFTSKMGKLSLMQTIDLMARAKLIITNDSAPFHLAVALGKKAVCVANPVNYGRFCPYPDTIPTQTITVYSKKVNELVKNPENIKKFQGNDSESINEITVLQVQEAVFSLLSK